MFKLAPSTTLKRIARPVLYDHLAFKRTGVIVNFASKSHQDLLCSFQLRRVPCANPECKGGEDGWDTEPVGWCHETRAPLTYIDPQVALEPSS